jgi:hypothetical protein
MLSDESKGALKLRHWLAMHKIWSFITICLLGGLALLRYLDMVDLAVASYFYSEHCRCFPANDLAGVRWLDQTIRWAGRLAIPILIVWILRCKYLAMLTKSNEQVYRQKIRALLFMIVLGMLTPVIFIHEVLKGEIGRARPRHVEQFSGTNSFTAAWVKSKACRGDCSFTSGHVAFGAWLMAGWYLGGRQRWLFLSLGAAVTSLIGWLRMAQGALCGAKYRTNNNETPQQQRL